MQIVFIYALVFVATLLAADSILRTFVSSRRAKGEINRRLALLAKGASQEWAYQQLLNERAANDNGLVLMVWLNRIYRQSGLTLNLSQKLAYSILLLIGSLLLAGLVAESFPVQVLFGGMIWLAVLLALLLRFRSRRINRFVTQLPMAIDIIVRSLNAGHPLVTAINLVAREMPDPIGSEFGLLTDQLTFGAELDVAMFNMVDRVGADELNLLAVTVSVQRGTGGNLSEILENLSGMIRDRTMLRAKIKAISAEGRITAVVMGVFPFLLYMMITTLVPDYFNPVWDTGRGALIVSGILAWMGLGMLILYKLVKFDF
jgi:tight adherence protein B